MKSTSSLSRIIIRTALSFALAAGTRASAATPTVTITSPKKNAIVTGAALAVSGSTKDSAAVTNVVVDLNGVPLTVTSSDAFSAWTAAASGLTPGTNTILAYGLETNGQATATNSVTFFYKVTAKLTATVNGRGGALSPNENGQKLNIGENYTIKAIPAHGFGFSGWTVVGATQTSALTNPVLTFQMVSNLQLTANFVDTQPPTVKITTKPARENHSIETISGTATDNVGVSSVWYEVGTSGWNMAASTDGYSHWTAAVILSPGANTIQVYAEDAAGNRSKTNSVTLTDSATGFAPESLGGTTLLLVSGGNSALLSFDGSTFTQAGKGGVTSGVGLYTYTVTDTNTALLAPNFTSPPGLTNTASESIILSFTNGAGGTFAKANGGTGGSFILGVASSTAPLSLSGLTLEGTNNEGGAYEFTNVFGDGVVTSTDTAGRSSGTYTFAQYSPNGGLLQETFTNGPETGTTIYLVLSFLTGTNSYYGESDTPAGVGTFSGTFSVSGKESTEGYTAPSSLDGLSAAVTEVKTNGERRSFVLTFGADTFGQFTTATNHNSGVGTYTLTRTGPKTTLLTLIFVAPPNAVGGGGGEVPLYFTTSHTANSTNSDGRATVTFSSRASTVPLSLVGRKLTGKSSEGGGSISFGYGTFTSTGNGGSGNYSYAPYGPQMALVTRYYTDTSDAGTVSYTELYFSSPTSGNYIKTDSSGSINSGTFTME